MNQLSSRPVVVVAALVAAASAIGAGVIARTTTPSHTRAAGSHLTAALPAQQPAATDLDKDITRTQAQLRVLPRDWEAWAALGLDYVQAARTTVDPTYYPKAAAALSRSLSLDTEDNVVAAAGKAALAAAQHDFPAALRWARRGLRIDPSSAVLYGALDDALTQLGRYDEARAAAMRMESLQPGTDAEARLSYAAELRGDLTGAVTYMQTALADAGSAADVAFARYYLAELALSANHPEQALEQVTAGLRVAPDSAQLLEGRAHAEAALGRIGDALRDLDTVVNRVPQPSYVLEYGELLQAAGRDGDAQRQYALFRVEEQLFAANGVALDVDETLFEADHGSVATAVAVGKAALSSRPFLDSYDAYAWALHRAGRDAQALAMSQRALSTGARNALFLFHRAAIESSLHQRDAARKDARAALAINATFNPLLAPAARELSGS